MGGLPMLPPSLKHDEFLAYPVTIINIIAPSPPPPLQDSLFDGANQRPSYTLRTLARTLHYARTAMPVYGFHRAMYDGASMCFLTLLDVSGQLNGFHVTGPSSVGLPSVLSWALAVHAFPVLLPMHLRCVVCF